ncbi:hypothetical protein IFM89_004859 [Coptis chinensis]|uniref:Protein FAR1-RELATED SEQUENCE n=1 Tax=Coptis chinensis TaxID=261450 RepID=A0A835I7I3_9MAGN|nr:hypothetical protein IFM89_004859 [Coptis chinensis]
MDNEPFCFDLNRYHEDVKGDAMEDVEFQRENEGDENDEVTQETLNKPEVGMTFDTVDDILEYYQKYGNEKGFPVKIRSSRKDDNGVTRYITLTCCREGKARSKDWAMNPESERRDRLCNAFYKGVELAIESEDTTQMAMGWIESFINELKNNAGKNANSQLTSLTRRVIDCNSKGSATLLDPLSVRRKGRPCSNRIVGRTEKYVQQQHKKQNSKKDDEIASKLPHGSEGISSYFNSLREKEIESHIPHCSQDVSSCLDANHDQLSIQFDASRGIPSQFAVSHNDFPMP